MKVEKIFFYLLTACAFMFLIIYIYEVLFSRNFDSFFVDFLIAGGVITQGILTIWMIRDIVNRSFATTTTRINWLTAVVFFGVFGTTLYYLKVKTK